MIYTLFFTSIYVSQLSVPVSTCASLFLFSFSNNEAGCRKHFISENERPNGKIDFRYQSLEALGKKVRKMRRGRSRIPYIIRLKGTNVL